MSDPEDEDMEMAAWAQLENEQLRRWEAEIATDPFYPLWIEHLEQQMKEMTDGHYGE